MNPVCGSCGVPMEESVRFPCFHAFCVDCANELLEDNGKSAQLPYQMIL